ncbi:MAG: AAA family ATPase [Anaerovoracaceae bacterium]|nr:AAA family ATPase [Anaerovoracaceae bacterium]
MAKLPIGIQSFEKLRRGGYAYVDKTMYISNLLDGGSVYFLSRPRRFGKSLFLTTLEAYFRGQRELFRGLSIEKAEIIKPENEQWMTYPVMSFYLSGGSFGTETGLEKILAFSLESFEKEYGIRHYEVQDLRADLPVWLKYCIEENFRLMGKQIVFLVDEYDKPILNNLTVNDMQEQKNRSLLKDFFSVLKDEDKYLKFAFFTGVTKFNKVSVFSDLNQLKDISLVARYSAICGITQKELESNFSDEIRTLSEDQNMTISETKEKLASVYDGYHFSERGEGVYNPFSVLNAFSDCRFGRYWFESGTPTFLVRKLAGSGIHVQDFTDGVQVTEDRMNNNTADDEDVVTLFYQTGYLTITGYDAVFREYTLSYPNEEVKFGYLNSLIPMVSPKFAANTGAFSASKMIRYLQNDNPESLMTMLQALLASIPYHEGKAPEDEQQWRNVVYAVFTLLGQYVRTEVHSAGGRSDCVIENEQFIYIFEFKKDRSAEEALKQIDDRGYALPYNASGKKVIKIGANFSSDKKTFDNWEIEEA